ncbi:unnamed protein product, partial [Iphiclides podalirius]
MATINSILFFLALFVFEARGSNPVVRIPHGLLQGTWRISTNGRNYASFQGVPYARPPVGKYRFREPQQLKPWLGIWDASKPLSECIQYDPFQQKVTGSENCLYVNVHTPKLNAGALLPVVVFIHGGAFMYGSGSVYDASHLMDRDMVVVTLNYRLGPLGFLSTGDEVIPGNAGLKDQSFALQWVKHNIMMFGGDPDSITLTGCSAGGASVHYHYLSPMSRDTFHRGIAFSGSAFASWTHSVKPAEKARSLAAIVGCPTTSNKEMADCLKYRPAEVIVNGQAEMFEWKVHLFTPFTPTHESPNSKAPFLTQYPYRVAKAGGMQSLPLITSVTSEEGLYPAAGVSHADDILLIYNFMGSSEAPADVQMRQILMDMLYSYASTGAPKVAGVEWQPVEPGSTELRYLEFASPTDVSMKTSTDFGNRSFWDSLGFVENENYNVYIKDEL